MSKSTIIEFPHDSPIVPDSITEAFRTYQPNRAKVRVGRPHDGGYVICDGLEYDYFLSGGIADDNSFELDMLQRLPPFLCCEAYDPEGSGGAMPPPQLRGRFLFRKEPVHTAALYHVRNALVKIDIEGGEWKFLANAPLGNIAQLVVEFHDPNDPKWDWDILASLAETHYLVHVHGNNWGDFLDINGVLVPQTIECTYVRKDLDPGLKYNSIAIPAPIDMPNLPYRDDLRIDWEPFVTR